MLGPKSFKPEESVLGIGYGEKVALSVDDLNRPTAAIFAELEAKSLDV